MLVLMRLGLGLGKQRLIMLARLGPIEQIQKVGACILRRRRSSKGRSGQGNICSDVGRVLSRFVILVGSAHECTEKAGRVLRSGSRGKNLGRERGRRGDGRLIALLVMTGLMLLGSLMLVLRLMMLGLGLLVLLLLVRPLARLGNMRRVSSSSAELEQVQQVGGAFIVVRGGHVAAGRSRNWWRQR